jgi:hypothetical protein
VSDFSFIVKLCSKIDTCSAHEYAMFTAVQLLSEWLEQQSSSQVYLDSVVVAEVGRVYCMDVDLCLILFLDHST